MVAKFVTDIKLVTLLNTGGYGEEFHRDLAKPGE